MLSKVVLGFPKPLECTNSSLPCLDLKLIFNGMSPIWYPVPDRYPLRDCLNFSSLLSTRCYLTLQASSDLCFLLLAYSLFCLSISLSPSFLQCLLHSHFTLSFCFLSIHGIKPICLMNIRFLFHPFGSLATIHLEFPASAPSPLHNVSQGSGHLSSHKLC